MRDMIPWSKLAAMVGIQVLWGLQCLPPNTLSAKKGDKAKDKVRPAGICGYPPSTDTPQLASAGPHL